MNGFFPLEQRTGQRKGCGGFRSGSGLRILGVVAGLVLCQARGEEGQTSALGILLEPKFTSPSVFQEIPGAQETVAVPARQTGSGAITLSAREWKEEGLEWTRILAGATERAIRLEKSMVIQWERDSRKVYQYAVIESKDPFISSVIYSPGFLEHFRENLGSEVLVVVPDRFSIYVFPRFGKALDEFGPSLVRRYEDAVFKVSLEVFLIGTGKGPRALGKIAN